MIFQFKKTNFLFIHIWLDTEFSTSVMAVSYRLFCEMTVYKYYMCAYQLTLKNHKEMLMLSRDQKMYT